MIRAPLHHDVAGPIRRLFVIEDQRQLALEHDPVVDGLGAMHQRAWPAERASHALIGGTVSCLVFRFQLLAMTCMIAATSVAYATPSTRAFPDAAPASCQPGKGGICVVFDGRIKGSQKAPHLVATSVKTTITWHLVWVTSRPGYGVPDQLEKTSTVGGKAVVMLQPGPTRCPTNFELIATNPPTLTQGPSDKGSLVIRVPGPRDRV